MATDNSDLPYGRITGVKLCFSGRMCVQDVHGMYTAMVDAIKEIRHTDREYDVLDRPWATVTLFDGSDYDAEYALNVSTHGGEPDIIHAIADFIGTFAEVLTGVYIATDDRDYLYQGDRDLADLENYLEMYIGE